MTYLFGCCWPNDEIIAWNVQGKSEVFNIQLKHEICSIKRIGTSKQKFIVKTEECISELRINGLVNNQYTFSKLFDCQDMLVGTHSLEVYEN